MAINRRNFVQYSGILGAAAAMGGGFARAAGGTDYDVVDIGAGMAGLTAALRMGRAGPGLKVLLLEARDRVGGRMYTAPDPQRELSPHGIELGAQVIHGSQAVTWELIKKFDLFTRSTNDLGEMNYNYFQPGQAIYPADWDTQERLLQQMRATWESYQGPDISYQAFVESMDLPVRHQEMLYEESASWSADPSRLSARAAVLDGIKWNAYQDEDFQLSGGYSSLAEKMAAELKGQIQLSSVVKEIFWSSGLAGISYDYRGSTTSLTTRRIVSTLPIGVMQSDQVAIQPPLPEWKQDAINSLEMGQVVVAQMRFSAPFWRQQPTAAGGFSTPDGDINFGLPHIGQAGGQAITGWFSGSAAQHLSELGEDAALERIMSWLAAATGINSPMDKLEWYRYKDWVSDPYSLGSYSITRPGGHGQREILGRPVENTLFFAGEATAPPPHYQTVHGAYMSGQRAAKEVAASLRAELDATLTEDQPVILEEDDAPIIESL